MRYPTGAPSLLHDLLLGPDVDPARVALVDGERRWTHQRLADEVLALARRLHAAGVQRGDRVAVLLPRSLTECAALFAASRADAVVVPVNPVLKAAQVLHIVTDSAARALVLDRAWLQGQPGGSDLLAALSAREGLALVAVDELPAAPGGADGATVDGLEEPRSIGCDLAAILYTSGSTGTPKGVMLTHTNLLAGTRIVRGYLGITAEDRILAVLPFSFDYGLNQLLTVVEQGATLVLLSFQMGDQIVRHLAEHRITGLAGVPTVWAILTRAAPLLLKTPLPHLRYITNSGGAVPEATTRRLRELLPATQIFWMYGLTEAFRSTFLPPSEIDRRPTSIGKAIPECEVFVVNAEGQRAAPGEAGMLVHRGPTVSMGYWRRPEDTARVLKPNPLVPAHQGADTVCVSGDLVYADAEGFLYFVGRADAMIKSAGYRISPTEVEDVLMSTGAFRQVAVVGLPDPWVGQKVCAVGVSVPLPVGQEPDTRGVLQAVAGQLPAHMVPGRIDWVDALPISPNGKVDTRRIVAERSTPEVGA